MAIFCGSAKGELTKPVAAKAARCLTGSPAIDPGYFAEHDREKEFVVAVKSLICNQEHLVRPIKEERVLWFVVERSFA